MPTIPVNKMKTKQSSEFQLSTNPSQFQQQQQQQQHLQQQPQQQQQQQQQPTGQRECLAKTSSRQLPNLNIAPNQQSIVITHSDLSGFVSQEHKQNFNDAFHQPSISYSQQQQQQQQQNSVQQNQAGKGRVNDGHVFERRKAFRKPSLERQSCFEEQSLEEKNINNGILKPQPHNQQILHPQNQRNFQNQAQQSQLQQQHQHQQQQQQQQQTNQANMFGQDQFYVSNQFQPLQPQIPNQNMQNFQQQQQQPQQAQTLQQQQQQQQQKQPQNQNQFQENSNLENGTMFQKVNFASQDSNKQQNQQQQQQQQAQPLQKQQQQQQQHPQQTNNAQYGQTHIPNGQNYHPNISLGGQDMNEPEMANELHEDDHYLDEQFEENWSRRQAQFEDDVVPMQKMDHSQGAFNMFDTMWTNDPNNQSKLEMNENICDATQQSQQQQQQSQVQPPPSIVISSSDAFSNNHQTIENDKSRVTDIFPSSNNNSIVQMNGSIPVSGIESSGSVPLPIGTVPGSGVGDQSFHPLESFNTVNNEFNKSSIGGGAVGGASGLDKYDNNVINNNASPSTVPHTIMEHPNEDEYDTNDPNKSVKFSEQVDKQSPPPFGLGYSIFDHQPLIVPTNTDGMSKPRARWINAFNKINSHLNKETKRPGVADIFKTILFARAG